MVSVLCLLIELQGGGAKVLTQADKSPDPRGKSLDISKNLFSRQLEEKTPFQRPRNMILREKFKIFRFSLQYTSISLNQGQESIFTLRECAQSIFHMILPLYRLFWQKKFSEISP